jgi:hypothetical protein
LRSKQKGQRRQKWQKVFAFFALLAFFISWLSQQNTFLFPIIHLGLTVAQMDFVFAIPPHLPKKNGPDPRNRGVVPPLISFIYNKIRFRARLAIMASGLTMLGGLL